MAAPSGTTDRFMTLAHLLGMPDADLPMLKKAMMAWMLPAHDHSFLEITMGAEPHCADCRVTDKATFSVQHYLEMLGEPETLQTWTADGRTQEEHTKYKERHDEVKAMFEAHIEKVKAALEK